MHAFGVATLRLSLTFGFTFPLALTACRAIPSDTTTEVPARKTTTTGANNRELVVSNPISNNRELEFIPSLYLASFQIIFQIEIATYRYAFDMLDTLRKVPRPLDLSPSPKPCLGHICRITQTC